MRVELVVWLTGLLEHRLATPRRRKSLRLTGSHRITGTRDIYTSDPSHSHPHSLTPFRCCTHPSDRGITRNKEIANLLPGRYCPTGAGVASNPTTKSYFCFYGPSLQSLSSSGNLPRYNKNKKGPQKLIQRKLFWEMISASFMRLIEILTFSYLLLTFANIDS